MVELDHIRVRDAMHQGILGCASDAPLGEVADIMCEHRVHAVAVTDNEGTRPSAVVSDLDVIAAIASGQEATAARAAATEPLAVVVPSADVVRSRSGERHTVAAAP